MVKTGDSQKKQEVDRIRCVELLNQGRKPCEIVEIIGRSRSWVYNCKDQSKMKSIYELSTKHGSGRKTKLTKKSKRIIRLSRNKLNGSTRSLVRKIRKLANENLSKNTIQRFQKKEGVKPFLQQYVPLLTEKNIEARKKFVEKFVGEDEKMWDAW